VATTRCAPVSAFFGRAGVAADGLASAFFMLLETRPEPAEAWSRYCWSMMFSENRYPLFGIML
jgi:hypothetical protein